LSSLVGIGGYRNTASHRTFDLGDVAMASEVVLLGDLFLRMLNPLAHDSSPRLRPPRDKQRAQGKARTHRWNDALRLTSVATILDLRTWPDAIPKLRQTPRLLLPLERHGSDDLLASVRAEGDLPEDLPSKRTARRAANGLSDVGIASEPAG